MNTVITHKIDGHEVIKGFGSLAVDPEATKLVVAAETGSTDEFKAAKVVADKLISTAKLADEKKKEARKRHKAGDKKGAEDIWKDGESLERQCGEQENELKPLVDAVTNRQNKLKSEKAVYFDAPAGEYVRTEAEILDLKEKVASGQGFVSLDGTILADNRGSVCCVEVEKMSGSEWSINRISSIGVDIPSDACLYGDLNAGQKKEVDLQIEIDNAANMTQEVRRLVLADKKEIALNQAAVLRSKLEISGEVDDPLVASQEWYDDRLRELSVIYG